MKQYLRKRQDREKRARAIGVALALGLHISATCLLVFSGIKYIYPPPPEQTFVIDFQEDETEIPVQKYRGRTPQAEEIDRTKPVELVQRSKSPYADARQNLTPETKTDEFGDVDVPADKPKEEPKLDPRASFPGMAKKDTSITAPHSSTEESALFKAGQAKGNTDSGKTDGTANAHVKGRSLLGAIPPPTYNVQKEGVVVVDIWVDTYGKVVEAKVPGEGTTVQDQKLWTAARAAAMKARFSNSMENGAKQHGTITYKFKLK